MVYIIFSEEGMRGLFEEGGYFKIGFTLSDPEARVRDLQTGNPENLSVSWKSFGDRDTERFIKELFSDFRTRGEWFKWCFRCYKRVDILNHVSKTIDKKYKIEEDKITKFNEFLELMQGVIALTECDDIRYAEYLRDKDIGRYFNLEDCDET